MKETMKKDNMPTIVNIYNEYFEKARSGLKKFAYVKYMAFDDNNICNIVFYEESKLKDVFNSAKLIAKDFGPIVKFEFEGIELTIDNNTAYDDLKRNKVKTLKRGRK
jgi:hypothetical protein